MKHGNRDLRIRYPFPNDFLDTIQAAEYLYHNLQPPLPIDIRQERYRKMGEFLTTLLQTVSVLPKKITMFTDNRKKIEAFSEGIGKTIEVERIPTETQTYNPHCQHHLQAKHGSPDYF